MLSGIGPAARAARARHPRARRSARRRSQPAGPLRGRRDAPHAAAVAKCCEGARFERDDPLWRRWNASGANGMYASNGAALGVVRRSEPAARARAGHLLHGAAGALRRLFPAASPNWIRDHHDRLTWAVLKAHTQQPRGHACACARADPRDTPLINFHYFEEGSDGAGEDLKAVVEAIRFVRRLTAPLLASGVIAEELAPGADVAERRGAGRLRAQHRLGPPRLVLLPDRRRRARAACWTARSRCTARGGCASSMRPSSRASRDSSSPAAVYMVAEKAADALLQDAATHTAFGKLTPPVDWLTLCEPAGLPQRR